MNLLRVIYDAIFYVAGFFCHQIPERSFFLGGVQLPLCVRCTAVLTGAALAVVYLMARRAVPPVRISAIMTLPMVVELSLVAVGVIETANALRFITAVLFGFFFLMGALRWIADRPSGSPKRPV